MKTNRRNFISSTVAGIGAASLPLTSFGSAGKTPEAFEADINARYDSWMSMKTSCIQKGSVFFASHY